jgi:hypothetical protein
MIRPIVDGQERIMRSDIAPGGTFPDFELPDHEKLPRKLSEIRTVQKDLDIQEYTDPEHDPIPHTLVLKPGLVIHSIYNGYCRMRSWRPT